MKMISCYDQYHNDDDDDDDNDSDNLQYNLTHSGFEQYNCSSHGQDSSHLESSSQLDFAQLLNLSAAFP